MQDQIASRSNQRGLKTDFHQKACVIEVDIVHAFARLDLLLLTVVDPRSAAEHRSFEYEDCTTPAYMPSVFGSMTEAKVHLELLMQKIGHFIASVVSPGRLSKETLPDLSDTQALPHCTGIYSYQGAAMPPAYSGQHAERFATLRRWFAAFEPLAREARLASKTTDKWQAMAHLQVHSRAFKVLLASITFTSLISYDLFLDDFKAIVSHALPVLEREAKSKQPCFNFDLSLIPPVGFVAICRCNWKVRREALRILEMPNLQHQSFSDKNVLAALARVVMETEENGLSFGEEIPEERRAKILNVSADKVKRVANVKLLQKMTGREVVTEKLIKW